MPSFYTPDQRAFQDEFHTRKMADRLQQVLVHNEVQGAERAFIESRDMFFLATVDGKGQPTCSYKGGEPGFVRVLDPRELAFPLYDGNGMWLSLGNIKSSAKVGMLFIDFETPHRLRVQGTATADPADPLLASCPGAEVIVRVAVSEIFVNCSRYIHKYKRVATSRYAPKEGCEAPFAEWKRIDVVQDALPPRDAGRTAKSGGAISMEEYEAKLGKGKA